MAKPFTAPTRASPIPLHKSMKIFHGRYEFLRISACGLYQRIARFDSSRSFGLFYHTKGYTILNAASSIKEFKLRIYCCFYPKALGNSIESHHRRITNLLSNRIHDHGRDLWGGHGRHGLAICSASLPSCLIELWEVLGREAGDVVYIFVA